MKKSLRIFCWWGLFLAVGCSDNPVGEKSDIESARVEPVSSKEISNSLISSTALSNKTREEENMPNLQKYRTRLNENPIVGKWGTSIGPDENGGYLHITWNIQSNGTWKGIVYADLAGSTNTFSTKWRLEGNDLYDVGETEDFLYVIRWIDNDKFKVVETEGMVLNAVFERNFIIPPGGGGGGHSECRFCDGSGYSTCQTCGGRGEVIGIGYNKETYNNVTQRYEYHWVQPYNPCVYCTNGKVKCINK